MANRILTGRENLRRNITGKRGKRNFTKPERKRITDILALNDWNYSRTMKELKKDGIQISIASLKNYRREFENQIENLPDRYIKNWEDEFNSTSATLIKKTLTLRTLIIDKMTRLILKAELKDLDKLTSVMQMLNQMTTGSDGGDGFNKTLSLIDQMNEHLHKQHEQKNKSKGDILDVVCEPVK